jgi:dTDP-4-dehydrorhamnose reductase
VETVLIAGVESIVGANLAAGLADRCRVVGLSTSEPIGIEGCETSICSGTKLDATYEWVASTSPDRIVYCGPAAHSAWEPNAAKRIRTGLDRAARNWALAAEENGCGLTMISSDAVFTGPWMFHEEDSQCQCPTDTAAAIRATEREVCRLCPSTLVVRTNVFGWSPLGSQRGWIERIIAQLETNTAGPFDCLRYATPLHATHLVEILEKAWAEEINGIYHVAGSERVNPARFFGQIADEFDLPLLRTPSVGSVEERPAGFGRGETSMQTRAVRKALCVAMPTLAEGIAQLREEAENGHRDRLTTPVLPLQDKVA